MKKILAIILYVSAVSVAASAQSKIQNQKIQRNGRSVEISFTVNAAGHPMPGNHKEVLFPYLYNGKDTLWLGAVEIFGKNRFRRERQWNALDGNRDWKPASDYVFKGDTLGYKKSVPYRNWMKNATLGLRREITGCGCTGDIGQEELVSDNHLYISPEPVLAEGCVPEIRELYTVKAKDTEHVFSGKEMSLYFSFSSDRLVSGLAGNIGTIDEITGFIKDIAKTGKNRLSKIEITGYASPEGRYSYNMKLAQDRAESIMRLLIDSIPWLKEDDFTIINGGENWSGLLENVNGSDMELKDEISATISTMKGEDRKSSIKAIDGGKAYEYMLHNFYPELRNVCHITVHYDELGDMAAEAVNSANKLASEGKYSEALRLLTPFTDDNRTFNTIGVCYMMSGQEEEAAEWFRKAMENGDKEAKQNLAQIEYMFQD